LFGGADEAKVSKFGVGEGMHSNDGIFLVGFENP